MTQMNIVALLFLLLVSRTVVVARNSDFPTNDLRELPHDEIISNSNHEKIDLDLDTKDANNIQTRFAELPLSEIKINSETKIIHGKMLKQNSTKIENIRFSGSTKYKNNLSYPTRRYVRIREGRNLQGDVDFSFLVDKPAAEWNGEEWAYFFLLFILAFIFGCCCCCTCCLGRIASSLCPSFYDRRGYRGNYSYGYDHGRYHRNRNTCCCCCNRGSSCVQDLFCLWCFWELCCTDDIIDSGGYQEGGW